MADYKAPTLQEVKDYLRIEHALEDNLIQICLDAAIESCAAYIGKNLDGVLIADPEFPTMNFTRRAYVGILMFTGLLYENRAFATPDSLKVVPLAIQSLWASSRDVGIY